MEKFEQRESKRVHDRQNMEKFEQSESKRVQDRQNMEKFEQRESKRGTGQEEHGEDGYGKAEYG
jgi:hypothetical protein